MKYQRLAVFIQNKRGVVYQVELNQDDMNMVVGLLSQIHGGKIRVYGDKIDTLYFADDK